MTTTAPSSPVSLWPQCGEKDENNISTIRVFLPVKSGGPTAGIIVCPGGSYGHLAEHEGAGYAAWLAQNGVAAFVLKYRLGSHGHRHPAMIEDAQRAIRYVRGNAGSWNINPAHIGIMGSSAGGHLAATALTHFSPGDPNHSDPCERQSSRPDFGILCYPVITMGEGTHAGSRKNLLGENPSRELVEKLSLEKQVGPDTPPCFIWHTLEDGGVSFENSWAFVSALKEARVPFDFHIYQKGGHGIGLASGKYGISEDDIHPWGKDLLFWLRQNSWLD